MLSVPAALQTAFEQKLTEAAIESTRRPAYRKWLRYYLDFCRKYRLPTRQPESLPRFLEKTDTRGRRGLPD